MYIPDKNVDNDQERILFIVDFFHHTGIEIRKEYHISKVDEFIKKNISEKAEKIELITSNESSCEIRVVDGKFMRQGEENEEFNGEVECLKGMRLKITLLPELGPLYDSLHVDLTRPGTLQKTFLGNHLKNLHSIFRSSRTFYAAFSGFIQSSGFGKTKLCLDLLLDHPGIYIVFRKDGQTGVPRMAKWMTRFLIYVKDAKIDDLPKPLGPAHANDSTPGRFLIALKIVLETYKSFIVERIEANIEKSEILNEINLFLSDDPLSECVPSKIFSEIKFESPPLTFSEVAAGLKNIVESILDLLGRNDFPFLIFLDELEIFKFDENSKRASGLNIVRRALHCLGTEIGMFTLAIGTNSDALDFTPEINDNSLRDFNRQTILPPFILSGNWDIFLYSVPYQDIVINRNLLANSAMFNVLASYGRPLWSSCRLIDVVTIAEAKLRNGFSDSSGALLALLLVRGNLSVNVHHALARTLIRSYMAIVNYVSTDANDMKIGYSSEPILAIASRSRLHGLNTRYCAFLALKEFLFQSAVDKGRITEAIFEYLLLFAIDDFELDTSRFQDNPDAPEFPPLIREKITRCNSFLLESQVKNQNVTATSEPSKVFTADSDLVAIRKLYYRILMLKEALSSLLNGSFEEIIFGIIKLRTQEAIVGTSHFIQLEAAQKEDFGDLPNFPGVKAMRRNVIDLALLKVGVRKQCGFTMPPNYFGIDFILPISIKRADETSNNHPQNDLFSFVAVQSKSSKPDIVECAFKMSAVFHLCRCPDNEHLSESDCIAKGCKAYMKMEDMISILDDQVVLLLTSNGSETRDLETTLSLKGRRVPEVKPESKSESVKLSGTAAGTMKTASTSGKKTKTETALVVERSKSNPLVFKFTKSGGIKRDFEQSSEPEIAAEQPKVEDPPIDQIIEDAKNNFGEEMASFGHSDDTKIKSVNFPEYFVKDKIPLDLQPDVILTKHLSKMITVQKMCWLYKREDLEALFTKKENVVANDETKVVGKNEVAVQKKDNIKMEKDVNMDVKMEEDDLKKRSVTCISINNITFFKHLICGEKGVDLLKEIINFSASNFQNVDKIHRPIVQNSMLNGISSRYYELDPTLQIERCKPLLDNPLANYKQVFNMDSLLLSIKDSIIGPINKIIRSSDTTQIHRIDNEEHFEQILNEMAENIEEIEIESEESESESKSIMEE